MGFHDFGGCFVTTSKQREWERLLWSTISEVLAFLLSVVFMLQGKVDTQGAVSNNLKPWEMISFVFPSLLSAVFAVHCETDTLVLFPQSFPMHLHQYPQHSCLSSILGAVGEWSERLESEKEERTTIPLGWGRGRLSHKSLWNGNQWSSLKHITSMSPCLQACLYCWRECQLNMWMRSTGSGQEVSAPLVERKQ